MPRHRPRRPGIDTVYKPNTTNTTERIRWFEVLLERLFGENYVKEPCLNRSNTRFGSRTYSTPDYVFPRRRIVVEHKQTANAGVKYQAGYYAGEVAATGYPECELRWLAVGTDGQMWFVRFYLNGIPQGQWETYGFYDMFAVERKLPPDIGLSSQDRRLWSSVSK